MQLLTNELRKLLEVFVAAATECAVKDFRQLKFERLRMIGGVTFQISDETVAAQGALTTELLKRMGAVRGHSKDIDPAIWGLVAECVQNGIEINDVKRDECLKKIQDDASITHLFHKPCANVRLPSEVDSLSLGPVRISKSSAQRSYLNSLHEQVGFVDQERWGLSILPYDAGKSVNIGLTPYLWEVQVVAAAPNREEETSWLIDVTLSLMRFASGANDLGPLASTIGKVEAHPTRELNFHDDSFSYRVPYDGGIKIGGMTASNTYDLSQAAIDSINSVENQRKAGEIYNARQGSLGERFFQGLGWLTRGRRANDRSTRLLYFFTAIESLLSDSNKTSPIVQTIARYASVLMNDDNEIRIDISRAIRDLYGLRSRLVHAGKRGVYDVDANSAEYIAEDLYLATWSRLNLTMSHQDFVDRLSKASYGLSFDAVFAP